MTKSDLTPLAQKLRREATREENKLWYQFLRNYPVPFRRQKVIGHYILDFYCFQAGLAVELDGSQHLFEDEEKDRQRTANINRQGIEVLRFTNLDVRDSIDAVCTQIDEVVQERMSKRVTH